MQHMAPKVTRHSGKVTLCTPGCRGGAHRLLSIASPFVLQKGTRSPSLSLLKRKRARWLQEEFLLSGRWFRQAYMRRDYIYGGGTYESHKRVPPGLSCLSPRSGLCGLGGCPPNLTSHPLPQLQSAGAPAPLGDPAGVLGATGRSQKVPGGAAGPAPLWSWWASALGALAPSKPNSLPPCTFDTVPGASELAPHRVLQRRVFLPKLGKPGKGHGVSWAGSLEVLLLSQGHLGADQATPFPPLAWALTAPADMGSGHPSPHPVPPDELIGKAAWKAQPGGGRWGLRGRGHLRRAQNRRSRAAGAGELKPEGEKELGGVGAPILSARPPWLPESRATEFGRGGHCHASTA